MAPEVARLIGPVYALEVIPSLLVEQSSEQLCAYVSAGIKMSESGSRLVADRIALEDLCTQLSFSQLSPVMPLGAF